MKAQIYKFTIFFLPYLNFSYLRSQNTETEPIEPPHLHISYRLTCSFFYKVANSGANFYFSETKISGMRSLPPSLRTEQMVLMHLC
jgi:hypothetical protein